MNYAYSIQKPPYTRNCQGYNCSPCSSAHHLTCCQENHITTDNWLIYIIDKSLLNCSLKPHKWITLSLFKSRPYTRNSKGYNCAPRSSAHHSSPRKPHNYWEFWLRLFWGRQTHAQWQELSKFIQKNTSRSNYINFLLNLFTSRFSKAGGIQERLFLPNFTYQDFWFIFQFCSLYI